MPESDLLGPLVDAIKTVTDRIREHRQELSSREYRTRMSLIDPILQALGWDVSDPKLVGVEYETTSKSRPDYALNHNEANRGAVLEAKSLGSRLEEREVDQVTTYANRLGAPYAALTDGDRWVVYNMRDMSPLPERKVLDITLSATSPHAAALKLLLLWRPNLETGTPVEAEEPIAGVSTSQESTSSTPPAQISDTSYSSSLPQLPRNPIEIRGELSLPDYCAQVRAEALSNPARRNQVSPDGRMIRKPIPKPKTIRFPGQSPLQINKGYDILASTADWLVQRGDLSTINTPFTRSTGRPIVAKDRTGMNTTTTIGGGTYFVETKLSQADVCRLTIELLEYCKLNPSDVLIQPS